MPHGRPKVDHVVRSDLPYGNELGPRENAAGRASRANSLPKGCFVPHGRPKVDHVVRAKQAYDNELGPAVAASGSRPIPQKWVGASKSESLFWSARMSPGLGPACHFCRASQKMTFAFRLFWLRARQGSKNQGAALIRSNCLRREAAPMTPPSAP